MFVGNWKNNKGMISKYGKLAKYENFNYTHKLQNDIKFQFFEIQAFTLS